MLRGVLVPRPRRRRLSPIEGEKRLLVLGGPGTEESFAVVKPRLPSYDYGHARHK